MTTNSRRFLGVGLVFLGVIGFIIFRHEDDAGGKKNVETSVKTPADRGYRSVAALSLPAKSHLPGSHESPSPTVLYQQTELVTRLARFSAMTLKSLKKASDVEEEQLLLADERLILSASRLLRTPSAIRDYLSDFDAALAPRNSYHFTDDIFREQFVHLILVDFLSAAYSWTGNPRRDQVLAALQDVILAPVAVSMDTLAGKQTFNNAIADKVELFHSLFTSDLALAANLRKSLAESAVGPDFERALRSALPQLGPL